MEKTRVALVYEQPFYAMLLNQCQVYWDDTIPTAGVRINEKAELELRVNKGFWGTLTDKHKIGLLMHEMLHLFHGHPNRGKELNHVVANIAMDIAINQLIPADILPDGACLPELFGFPKGLAFEPYYIMLMQQGGENGLKDANTLDDHNWKDVIGDEIASATLQNAIKSAVQATNDLFPGKLPLHVKEYLSKLSESKVCWKSVLRSYIGRNLSQHKESTRTKPNRRVGFSACGSKSEYVPKILIACDNSGSVSNDQVSALLAEAQNILKNTSDKTEVVYFDTSIVFSEKLSKISKPMRHASGGTDFQCVIDYANKQKPDLLIMLTDGECSAPSKARYPVLWVIAGNYPSNHLSGKVIRIV